MMVSANKGIPVEVVFTPGAENGMRALKRFSLDIPAGSTIYGDRAYNHYEFEDFLSDHAEIRLLAQRRRNSKRPLQDEVRYIQSRMRKKIETVFSQIAGIFPRSIHAVTSKGFGIKVFNFTLAYTFNLSFKEKFALVEGKNGRQSFLPSTRGFSHNLGFKINISILKPMETSDTPLKIEQLANDPLLQFQEWLASAREVDPKWWNAMALATADGAPSCRMVLLKEVTSVGLVFYTNYSSRKGQEIGANPRCAATFFWPKLERQVVVEGEVEKLLETESASYFASRSRESQLGAWASNQDEPLSSRSVLDASYKEMEERFVGKEIPLPPYWGGYRILPIRWEFWQGRTYRLHDRFSYTQKGNHWEIKRLAP